MTDILVRCMAAADKKNVVAIAHAFYGPNHLTLKGLEDYRAEHSVECEVAVPQLHHDAIGYMIYTKKNSSIELYDIAGTASAIKRMLMKLIEKVRIVDGDVVKFMVRERNLKLQNLLKENGFKAVSTERSWFNDTDEDAYFFRYEVTP